MFFKFYEFKSTEDTEEKEYSNYSPVTINSLKNNYDTDDYGFFDEFGIEFRCLSYMNNT